jgi:hypothetical protein
MNTVDLMFQTVYSELSQRALDAHFVSDFSPNGSFVSVSDKGREYWYFDEPNGTGGRKRKYVGPASDPEISLRVAAFKELKSDLTSRRKLVQALRNQAGLLGPDRFTGDIIQAMALSGFFRLRGVMVGAVAYQVYAGLLGVKLPAATIKTDDADFAQFHSISAEVEDRMTPGVAETLRQVDPSFTEVMNQIDGRKHTKFKNATGYMVEFLTPNRGSDENQGRPTPMPALGDTHAQPLRYLDFLIHDPVRAVLLHRGGVPVTVPAPERFAVHKLIISTKRRNQGGPTDKRLKDVFQATVLMEALIASRRQDDLAEVYAEAWDRGPSWQEALTLGLQNILKDESRRNIIEGLRQGMEQIEREPTSYGLSTGDTGFQPKSQ